LVSRLLEDPRLDTIIDPPAPFGDAPALYERLDSDPGARLLSVLWYSAASISVMGSLCSP
jgi:hypothetical protein